MTPDWDAIVVGAGIIGCAIARELASRGQRTALLEPRAVGAGATQASAGVLAPYIEAPGDGPLQELTTRSLALYDRFVADLEREVGRPLEYRRCGTMEIASDMAGVVRLQALASWAQGKGIDTRWLGHAEAARLEPSLTSIEGALLVPTHGYVAAGALADALVEAATGHGALMVFGEQVESVRPDGAGVRVTTTAGSHTAAKVIIAAGSWSGGLMGDAAAVKPVRGQLLRLRWNVGAVSRVLWGDRCYIVPWTDGTLLVGATTEDVGFDQRTTVAGVRALLDAANDLLPGLWQATFVQARAGLRPSTVDGLPLIGYAPESRAIVYATGHYRNGILLAPLSAMLVADLVVDGVEDEALALTSPSRLSAYKLRAT
jgi:glycine oxidase